MNFHRKKIFYNKNNFYDKNFSIVKSSTFADLKISSQNKKNYE